LQKINDDTSSKQAFSNTEQTSDITDPKTEIKDMETHAQELHKAPGRGWKHYFFEFFMLFLAVFCGFLAENFREKIVNNTREHGYMKSLAEDLKQDTARLNKIIAALDLKLLYRDSLLHELANPDVFKSSAKAYYFFNMSYHFPDFIYTDRTIQQLKNSGAMLLIKNTAVSDSIMDYDSKVKTVYIAQTQLNTLALTIASEKNKLFQNRLLDTVHRGFQNPTVPLLSQNKVDVEEFYNNMHDQGIAFLYLKNLDADLLSSAIRLINFINKEYKLDNEWREKHT
jgi:hypothetical protein